MNVNNIKILKELEKIRKRKLLFYITSRIVRAFFIITIIGYFYASFTEQYEVQVLFFNCLFAFFIFFPICKYNPQFDRTVKKILFEKDIIQIKDSQINWKITDVKPEEIIFDYEKHKIFKINKTYFKSDDTFYGTHNGTNFLIYEISVKRNSILAITKIFGNLARGFIATAMLSIVGGFVAGIISQCVYEWYPYFTQFFWGGWLLSLPFSFWLTTKYFTAKNGFGILCFGKPIDSFWETDLNVYDNFQGVIVDFDFKKKTKGHTLIFENNKENRLVELILTSSYEKVKLEDVEFNKKFSVYTTDQIEARYILTTGLMERLNQLKQCFKSKYIRASFLDGKFIIAIQSEEDLFKLGSLTKGIKKEFYQKAITEMDSILNITENLKLDNEIGL